MDNIDPLEIIIGALILLLVSMSIFVFIFGWFKRRRHRHKLRLQVHFITHKNNLHMASINSITLTDALPHTGLISVTDNAGNTYTGTLANVIVTPADPTQDSATVDPTTPNTIDVQEKNPTGGTTVSVTADFTSQGNTAPAVGSTAQAIPDGTVFSGLTVPGGVIVINKVTAQLKLQVAF